MTFEIWASRVAFVKSLSASSWDGSGAMQGEYAGGSPRVGAVFFPGLENVRWEEQEISEIRLMLTYANAGGNWAKTLYLHEGSKAGAPSGNGGQMLRDYIGAAGTNGSAYSATRTVYFNAESNGTAFEGLKRWMLKGVYTLALYHDESAGSGKYSGNYLKITDARISVDYTPKGSSGILSRSEAQPGESITVAITPAEVSGRLTHRVCWKLGGAKSPEVTLPEGSLKASYVIPWEWLNQLPDSETGTAQCVLTTMVDDVERGKREISFTVNVPDGIGPVFEGVICPYGTENGYYQKLGAARITAENAKGQYGASISEIRITGSEGMDATGPEAVTEVFAQSGVHSYTVTATDSRGRTEAKNLTIAVQAVADPRILGFLVQRYEEYTDDDGKTSYRASPQGTRVWVTLSASCDPAGGNNVPGGEISSPSGVTPLPWNTGSGYATTENRALLGGEYDLNSAHDFTLTVKDRQTSVKATVRVESGYATMVIDPWGVSFGGYPDASEDEPQETFYRKAVFKGTTDGLIRYQRNRPVSTGKRWVDGRMIYVAAVALEGISGGVNKQVDTGITAQEVEQITDLRGCADTAGGYTKSLPFTSISGVDYSIHMEALQASDGAIRLSLITGREMVISRGIVYLEFTMPEEYERIFLYALHDEAGNRLTDENGVIFV